MKPEANRFPMKPLSALSAALLTLTGLHAQDRFQQEAYLIFDASDVRRVWIGDADDKRILYYETERGVDSKTMRSIEAQAIWLVEPPELKSAMESYQDRAYEQALAAFTKLREEYLKLREIKGNVSARAALYEMECLRKLGRYDELLAKLETFTPDDRGSLTREHELGQIDLYVLYDAITKEQWERLEGLARERVDQPLPGYQKVQVGYALGLALEKQEKPMESLEAYNLAMTADTGASEVLTAEAALGGLRVLNGEPSVKEAIERAGTEAEDPDSPGARRLAEAGALARLFELTLGNGRDLPSEFRPLLEFAPEPPAAPTASDGEE